MIHLRQNLRLPLEPCKLRTGYKSGWQNLDRDIALQLSVKRGRGCDDSPKRLIAFRRWAP
jgi:hypothetical protein